MLTRPTRTSSAPFALAFALLLCAAPGMLKADEAGGIAQREVSHLLQYLETSMCAFYRNGTWHSAHEARVHLEEKYRVMQRWSRAISAEDFLARAATASSVTGAPYQVRCGASEPVRSARWLEIELLRYRATVTGAAK